MTGRISIENKTQWQTEHLAAFVREVAKRTLDKSEFPIVVLFNYSRRGGISGHAYTSPIWREHKLIRFARIHIPSTRHGAMWTIAQNKRALAEVIEHELLHTFGQEHTRERGHYTMSRHGYSNEERYGWADALPIEPKVVVKLPVDYDKRRADKLAHGRGEARGVGAQGDHGDTEDPPVAATGVGPAPSAGSREAMKKRKAEVRPICAGDPRQPFMCDAPPTTACVYCFKAVCDEHRRAHDEYAEQLLRADVAREVES